MRKEETYGDKTPCRVSQSGKALGDQLPDVERISILIWTGTETTTTTNLGVRSASPDSMGQVRHTLPETVRRSRLTKVTEGGPTPQRRAEGESPVGGSKEQEEKTLCGGFYRSSPSVPQFAACSPTTGTWPRCGLRPQSIATEHARLRAASPITIAAWEQRVISSLQRQTTHRTLFNVLRALRPLQGLAEKNLYSITG